MEQMVQKIKIKNVKKALRESKNNRAPGPGEIKEELRKYGRDKLI